MSTRNLIHVGEARDRSCDSDIKHSRHKGRTLSRLTLSTSHTCNMRCIYCYANFGRYGGVQGLQDTSIALRAVELALQEFEGIGKIQFFGGEPTLNIEVIRNVVDYVEERCSDGSHTKPQYSIITNATIITQEMLDLFSAYRFHIIVSLDGPEKIHNYLRPLASGSGTYHSIMTNIGKLQVSNIDFDIECTYTAAHIEREVSVEDLLIFFSDLGASEIAIVPVMIAFGHPLDVYARHFDVFEHQYEETIMYEFDRLLRAERVHFSAFIKALRAIRSTANGGLNDRFCPAGISNFAVSQSGDIYPCHLFIDLPEFKMGNVKTQDSIAEYDVPTYEDVPECQACIARSICTSCIGRTYFHEKNLNLPFSFDCELKRHVIRCIIQLFEEHQPLAPYE